MPRRPPSPSAPATIRRALLAAALAAGCGAPQAGAPPDEPPPPRADDPSGAGAGSPRLLPWDAGFAALVAGLRAAWRAGDTEGRRGCLLALAGPEGGAHRLEADLAVALRPLPDPPADARARWRDAPGDRAGLLSVWGRYGAGDGPVLAALTTSPPPTALPGDSGLTGSAAAAVLVSPDGERWTRWIAPADVPSAALEASAARGALPVWVTATPDTPVPVLARALEALAREAPSVALAVLLPAGTEVPAGARGADAGRAGLCPDGLPAAERPEGDVPVASLRQGIAPLVAAAERCKAAGSGPVARGGRLELQLRVAPDGAVAGACVTRDDVGDAVFRGCVLEAAAALRFVAPRPEGTVVDAALPLVVSPDESLLQRPVCR